MPDRYSYARKRVAAKLAEFNTGNVKLLRQVFGVSDETKPWKPARPVPAVYTTDARVDGVSAEHIDEVVIKATDRIVIMSPKVTDEVGAVSSIVPLMTDIVKVDGVEHAIKKIEAVPAAGNAACFHLYISA